MFVSLQFIVLSISALAVKRQDNGQLVVFTDAKCTVLDPTVKPIEGLKCSEFKMGKESIFVHPFCDERGILTLDAFENRDQCPNGDAPGKFAAPGTGCRPMQNIVTGEVAGFVMNECDQPKVQPAKCSAY